MPHKTTFVRCGRHDIARAVERLGGLHHLTTALGYSNPRPAGAGATQWQAHVSKVAAVTKLSGKQVRGRGGFLAAMHVLAVPPPGSGRGERAPGPTALTLPPPTGAVSRGSMHIRQGAQGRRAGPGGERGVVAGRSRRSAPGRWGPQRAGFPWCRSLCDESRYRAHLQSRRGQSRVLGREQGGPRRGAGSLASHPSNQSVGADM